MPSPIHLIDAGCRYGLHPTWCGVPNLRYHGFDPDTGEILRLRKKYRGKSYIFNDKALSDSVGTKNFRRLRHHGQSTLHEPNLKSAWFGISRFGEGEVEEVSEVECISIDAYCAGAGFQVDFIKTDTEGHDFEVLKGAASQLAGVLAVRCEAQFEEVFHEAAMFPEIMGYLRSQGFYLLNLDYNGSGSSQSYFATGNRFGILTGTDACFVRRFDAIPVDMKWSEAVLKQSLFLFRNHASDVALCLLMEAEAKGLSLPLKSKNKGDLVEILDVNFCRVANKLNNVPGDGYQTAKQDYLKFFGKEFPEKHLFFESELLNPA